MDFKLYIFNQMEKKLRITDCITKIRIRESEKRSRRAVGEQLRYDIKKGKLQKCNHCGRTAILESEFNRYLGE